MTDTSPHQHRLRRPEDGGADGQEGPGCTDGSAGWGSLATVRVLALRPSGPLLGARRRDTSDVRPGTLRQVLAARDRATVALLTAGWAVAFIAFWVWWLEPSHRVGWFGLLLNSALLFYLSYLPSYFLVAANRQRGIDPALPVPPLRVAFVVTRAPSEPWPVARTTLEAMLAQGYPHPYETWLCDEDPPSEALAWCSGRGVKVSTRRGVEAYHRAEWPRRTKCKEGNLAYFYDHWGYREYDVVVQLDVDHVPRPTYLAEMVRPFVDPSIGYVAAPSVCDTNAPSSWSARGRLHKEGTFHGPFQLGHHGGLAPLCIGSHYAVRTRAIRDIGGLGPELAEDFSTTFLLNSAGWQGAFAHRAEAHGDGPHTFSTMLTQEFQWSRSLVTLLYDMLPQHLGRMPWRLRLRFLFALTYYPLLALTSAVGLALPPIAVLTGVPWVQVNYVEFLLRWGAVSVWLLLITAVLRHRGLLRPPDAPLISWENWLYTLARWPYIARGVLAATAQKLWPRPVGFRVTPKSRDDLERLPGRLIAPYVVITLTLSATALAGAAMSTPAAGYVFLCILGAALYAVVAVAVPVLHAREAAREASVTWLHALRATAAVPATVGAATLLPLLTAAVLFVPHADVLLG